MFEQLLDFSHQRTNRQALGWYLVFALVGIAVGVAALLAIYGPDLDLERDALPLARTGLEVLVVYVALLGALLIWQRDKDPFNIFLVLAAIVTTVFPSILVGLGLLAVLTTRPSGRSG